MGNITLSIDNIVMDLHISNPAAREELMHLLEKLPITHAVEVINWDSFRIGSFREQFTIRFQDGNSFWLGVVLNGRKPERGRVRLDFNPNKVANHKIRRKAATADPDAMTAPQGRTFENRAKGGGDGDPGRPKAARRNPDGHTWL